MNNRMLAPATSSACVRDRVPDAEWQVRVDLAASYRLMARYGMSDLIYNHITAKVPGREGQFLINPFGMLYPEITASCFYTLDYDGRIVDKPDTPFAVNQAGFVIHSAIHKARPDLHCVMHTHTRAGMTVSTLKEGLLPLTQTAMRFYEAIGYHDYEVPTADISERERLAQDLGQHNAIVLRNHGLVACGASVAEAFNLMYWLETACKVQVDALSLGRELVLPSHELATRMAHRYAPQGSNAQKFAHLEWQALRRQLDREDPGYRD